MDSEVDVSSILSSQARFKVLESIALLSGSLRLREMERETGLAIRSVQVATERLVEEGVIVRDDQGRFLLNPASPASEILRGIFRYLRNMRTSEAARSLTKRAMHVISLSEEVSDFVSRARRLD